jgi:phosphoenolpyruvate phosphomutase
MKSIFKGIQRGSSFYGFSTKRTTQLKNLIRSKELEFIMEAHNGLSALIVEEAGFKGTSILQM